MPVRREQHRAARVIATVVVIGGIALLSHPTLAAAQDSDPSDAERRKLEAEIDKLEADTAKIRAEHDRESGLAGWLIRGVPLATAIVAVGGVVLTWRKQLTEAAHARDAADRQRRQDLERRQAEERADRELRNRELLERERELKQRFDEMWSRTLENLGSTDVACQAMGAASLRTYFQADYADMVPEVFDVITAILKLDREPFVYDLLRPSFERALRECATRRALGDRLDLTNLHLDRVDFEGLDLTGVVREVDVAFASLRNANLTGAKLPRLLGYGAETRLDKARLSRAILREARLEKVEAPGTLFHETVLTSAKLKEANLKKADFRRARLQSAHFDGAHLEGASFEQANVSDTFFLGANFDDAALRSLARAAQGTWRKAHLDDDVRARLEMTAHHPPPAMPPTKT